MPLPCCKRVRLPSASSPMAVPSARSPSQWLPPHPTVCLSWTFIVASQLCYPRQNAPTLSCPSATVRGAPSPLEQNPFKSTMVRGALSDLLTSNEVAFSDLQHLVSPLVSCCGDALHLDTSCLFLLRTVSKPVCCASLPDPGTHPFPF